MESPPTRQAEIPTGRFADYYPAWPGNLADDVTIEGSLLAGGRPAVGRPYGGAVVIHEGAGDVKCGLVVFDVGVTGWVGGHRESLVVVGVRGSALGWLRVLPGAAWPGQAPLGASRVGRRRVGCLTRRVESGIGGWVEGVGSWGSGGWAPVR